MANDGKKKILLVDDEELIIKSIKFKLQQYYDITSCNDGKEAIELINSVKPDLIISDIMMPFMSGIELLDIVKSRAGDPIPIILVSSLDEVEVINVALDIGADDFVVKPINMDELQIRVSKILDRKEDSIGNMNSLN